MEKHTINVPSVAEFARPRSRRNFFKALAAAGVGATAGSVLLSRKASAQSTDVDIANFALTLEYLEAEFYGLALDAGVVTGDALAVVEAIHNHEVQHVDAITTALEDAGATPVAKPEFVFPDEALTGKAGV